MLQKLVLRDIVVGEDVFHDSRRLTRAVRRNFLGPTAPVWSCHKYRTISTAAGRVEVQCGRGKRRELKKWVHKWQLSVGIWGNKRKWWEEDTLGEDD